MSKDYWVYILANKGRSTLYIGMTGDLERRMWEHCHGVVKGFTEKYSLKYLMYFEMFPNAADAFQRERQLKKWERAWKERLIETMNPEWRDLGAKWKDG